VALGVSEYTRLLTITASTELQMQNDVQFATIYKVSEYKVINETYLYFTLF